MRIELTEIQSVVRQGDAGVRGHTCSGAPADRGAGRAGEAVPAQRAVRVGTDAIEAARAEANEAMAGNGCELSFEFDDGAGRVVAKLIDKRSGELLRQVPSEEMLAVARALRQGTSAGGLLSTDA
jgi:flagellar protein FlaG